MSENTDNTTVWDGVTCVACETRRVRVPPNPEEVTRMEAWMGGRPAYCQECYDEMVEDDE